jgi:hypothetical protein
MVAMQISFPNERLREVVKSILSHRSINRTDQKVFMSALLSKDKLSLEDQKIIDQVYQGLQSGLIKVID